MTRYHSTIDMLANHRYMSKKCLLHVCNGRDLSDTSLIFSKKHLLLLDIMLKNMKTFFETSNIHVNHKWRSIVLS